MIEPLTSKLAELDALPPPPPQPPLLAADQLEHLEGGCWADGWSPLVRVLTALSCSNLGASTRPSLASLFAALRLQRSTCSTRGLLDQRRSPTAPMIGNTIIRNFGEPL